MARVSNAHENELEKYKYPQGVDLAYIQTGISGVFSFYFFKNFENLYFFGTSQSCCILRGLLNKCCIF